MATNKEKLGALGESIVARLMNGVLSEDKFDSVKDMTLADSSKVEVKTQNRHPNGTFTINAMHVTNANKCMNVDHLIFVEYDSSDIIKVYECVDRKNYKIFNTKPTPREPEGRLMMGWPINTMNLIKEIKDAATAQKMRDLSGSRLYTKHSEYSF